MIFVGLVFLMAVIYHYNWWRPRPLTDYYLSKPLWFAHRGVKSQAPENTIAAFNQADKLGFQAWEVDVVSTADGQVVCSHNFDLERETDGFGYINELNLKNLKKIKAGKKGEGRGEPLPTLDQVLDIKPKAVRLIVEIKTRAILDFRTALRIIRIIKKRKLQKYTIITSFNPLTIWFVKLMDWKLFTGFNLENIKSLWYLNLIHPDCLNPAAELVTEDLFKLARIKNLPLNVWTVNTGPAVKWLAARGVDGIITDRPEFIY
ncbi:MAG: glycerophosphodiester phosphodiesterase family protein [Candidatus Neomarinimicrobiota bacterium]